MCLYVKYHSCVKWTSLFWISPQKWDSLVLIAILSICNLRMKNITEWYSKSCKNQCQLSVMLSFRLFTNETKKSKTWDFVDFLHQIHPPDMLLPFKLWHCCIVNIVNSNIKISQQHWKSISFATKRLLSFLWHDLKLFSYFMYDSNNLFHWGENWNLSLKTFVHFV